MGKTRKNIINVLSKYLGRTFFLRSRHLINHINRSKENILIRNYQNRTDKLVISIAQKEKINIVFFVISMSMWKYHDLFLQLKDDTRYNPVIVPFVVPYSTPEISKEMRDDIIEYCQTNSFTCEEYFDYKEFKYKNCENLYNADVVVFTQPYDTAFKELKIKNFMEKSLFLYTPYGVQVDESSQFYDNLLQNIAKFIFLSCPLELECQKQASRNHGQNARVVGLQIFDEIKNEEITPWKEDNRKKIIWAPHHSIRKIDMLYKSNFLEICDDMLELAKQTADKFQFAFKPHPSLRGKLNEIWGRDKTDWYYKQWDSLENTFVADSRYAALFKFSDALIHDCSSFTCEYLVTGHPALFLSKGGHNLGLNEFGSACYDQHYKGSSIKDIRHFLENQVSDGNDYMKENRNSFVEKELISYNDKGVGKNMFNSLEELLSYPPHT